MLAAVSDLKKAEAFGPGLSVIDGVVNSSRQSGADACYESYLKAEELCPGVTGTLSEESLSAIREYEQIKKQKP